VKNMTRFKHACTHKQVAAHSQLWLWDLS